jgi:predicted TIM-barrel fold metal-dependent hydrolase
MVAVESGIGWIPFILETMDYELSENAPDHFKAMKRKPSEYFAKHWYATFWFEEGHGQLQNVMDIVGDERILFETDFPHPTCLYPAPVESVAEKMGALRPETQARVMGDNARKLYRL